MIIPDGAKKSAAKASARLCEILKDLGTDYKDEPFVQHIRVAYQETQKALQTEPELEGAIDG